LDLAKEQGLDKVFVHAVTDGRDTPTKEGIKFIDYVQKHIAKTGTGRIATLCGRYFAMDRNRNWDRLEKAFLAYTAGEGLKESDPQIALGRQYAAGTTDEYLEPVVITGHDGAPVALLEDNDVVINFNYRADRARQFSHAFLDRPFTQFKRAKVPEGVHYVGFTEYEEGADMPVVFPPQKISTRLGEILSRQGKKQLRIAETEKYAHVTYFFNGGTAAPYPGEDRIIVPSKNARSYAEVPAMSAPEVNEKLLNALEYGQYDFILVNYANPDMVGHTGNFKAAIKALEATDECLSRLVSAVLKKGGCLLVTADHGNIEEMVNLETGEIDTQHSTNPVPIWFVANDSQAATPIERPVPEIKGMLADITATILNLFNLRKPAGMIGESLLLRFDWKKAKK
jgi:2,3-bisphosphoglycerate-independent phosphoglycerate mutase